MTRNDALQAILDYSQEARQGIVGSDAAKLAGDADKVLLMQTFIHTPQFLDPISMNAIYTEVAVRGDGETPLDLANYTMAKVGQFRTLKAYIDGLEYKLLKQVKTLPEETPWGDFIDAAMLQADTQLAELLAQLT